jgi:hypothetical protein
MVKFDVSPVLERDKERGPVVVGECMNHINDAFRTMGVRARLSYDNQIVITSDKLSITGALEYIYKAVQEPVDLLLVTSIGNQESEDDDMMYQWAHDKESSVAHVYTVTMGNHPSAAAWSIEGTNKLITAMTSVSRFARIV